MENPLLSLKFDQKAKIYCSQIKMIYSIPVKGGFSEVKLKIVISFLLSLQGFTPLHIHSNKGWRVMFFNAWSSLASFYLDAIFADILCCLFVESKSMIWRVKKYAECDDSRAPHKDCSYYWIDRADLRPFGPWTLAPGSHMFLKIYECIGASTAFACPLPFQM